jgi:uncharacterized membrane protein
LARELVLAAQIAGTIGLVVVSAPGMSWTSMIEAESDLPLLGLVILAVAAFATSRTLQHAKSLDEGSSLAATMLLSSGIWWLKVAGVFAAWFWLNLILLRSAAHYLGIDYRFADLAASNTVQALLSLVWAASAFVLMRIAARTATRRLWWGGALLLGIVVAKLFLIDLASGGSIALVVSFVGVGLLLLLVGYLAPYPKATQDGATTAPA